MQKYLIKGILKIYMGENKVLDGLFGLCIGDALGVPVEFVSREYLKTNPVKGMIGYGTHNQPPGTWSDDSSLTFCLAESLCNGYNLRDIANKFCRWLYEGYWTPYNKVFDVGSTTKIAISAIKKGVNPIEAGGKSEYDNGNGSLMRILPLAFYIKDMKINKRFKIIHEVSSITHSHIRSLIACGIYIEILINILKGNNLRSSYEDMKKTILNFYKKQQNELRHFKRILKQDISEIPEYKIKSRGYAIDTLEAALWCCLNNDSYKKTVLATVNLGGDTDTIGAVAGGLAGLYYGFKNIPKEWINVVARKEDIIELANKLNNSLKL